MIVHYYNIYNCQFCNDGNNHPILVPPLNTDPVLLRQRGFILSPDNTWIHYLTEQEYNYIITNQYQGEIRFIYNEQQYASDETPEEKKNGNKLGLISLGLFVVPFVLGVLLQIYFDIFTNTADYTTISNSPAAEIINIISSLCRIGSFVTMIITRAKYHKNKIGIAMMWVFIISAVLTIIAAVLLIIACGQCLNEMRSCPG